MIMVGEGNVYYFWKVVKVRCYKLIRFLYALGSSPKKYIVSDYGKDAMTKK